MMNLPPSALPESLRVLVVPHPTDPSDPRRPAQPVPRREPRLRSLLARMRARPGRSVERSEPVELSE